MNKLIVICGPTATGKTSLGIKLAKKFNGEIVSADSRQVYRYLDIGTGKDLPEKAKGKRQKAKVQLKIKNYKIGYYEIENIPIWLYDVVEPSEHFSAGEYAKLAWWVIKDIWRRGKLPILVGGSGFYLKAVIDGLQTLDIPADWKLRERLGNYETAKLRNLLKKLDSQKLASMNESDRNNPRRLIRAIEIARKSQKSKVKSQSPRLNLKTKNVFMIGLKVPRQILYQRIDRRVEERLRQGIISEIKELLKRGYSFKDPGLNTLGYQQWQDYFAGKASREQVIQKWKFAEHAYARRQMTWFKKEGRIKWFDIRRLTPQLLSNFLLKELKL